MQNEGLKKFHLDGKNTRQVGQEKTLKALTWVYRWGYSTPTLCDMAVSIGRDTKVTGVASRLAKRMLLNAYPTPSGGIKGEPRTVLTLTENGVIEVEAELEEVNAYEEKIPWHQLRHDTLVQQFVMTMLTQQKIAGYKTPRELAEKSEASKKMSDAILIFENGSKAALELELSAKRGRELDQTVLAMIRSLEDKTVSAIFILSQSQAILNNYKKAFAVGNKITTYKRNSSRHWYASGQFEIEED